MRILASGYGSHMATPALLMPWPRLLNSGGACTPTHMITAVVAFVSKARMTSRDVESFIVANVALVACSLPSEVWAKFTTPSL